MLQSKVETPLSTIRVAPNGKTATWYIDTSVKFFFKDKRKLTGLILVLTLPVINNLWRFVPKDISFAYYDTLYAFVWTLGINLISVIIAIAWLLTIPRKDVVLQTMASLALFYGLLLSFQTLPITETTPLWVDIVATIVISFIVYLCVKYIRNHYLDRPMDYKMLHDGLIHDLHHQRFMGSINRIEGLIHVANMEEPYKDLCEKELEELKRSVAYIADKYNELS